jgi:hypothetical protein
VLEDGAPQSIVHFAVHQSVAPGGQEPVGAPPMSAEPTTVPALPDAVPGPEAEAADSGG